jgi:hypothetical protein
MFYAFKFNSLIKYLFKIFIRINDLSFTSSLNSSTAMTSTVFATDQNEVEADAIGW